MSTPASRLVCSGCGSSPPDDEPFPFRCPRASVGDVDHVLVRLLDPDQCGFPPQATATTAPASFVAYRRLFHSYWRAAAGGIGDEDLVELLRGLDARVAAVDGHGFAPTPLFRSDVLSDALGFVAPGGVWVKDETGNVSGSHKARHLMGVLVHLAISEQLGLSDPAQRPQLAIASCGNAALAAAVVAAAGSWPLTVFVPPDADAAIMKRLSYLGAEICTCERHPGEFGDPCYLRLLEALERGAIPFTCQGNLNGLAIEGGETLGYEIVSSLAAHGAAIDHAVVQVGGGALASSCAQAFSEARALGAFEDLPRLHTVQTTGAHPLERAYRRVQTLLDGPARGDLDEALSHAASHRSSYMWPWEQEPRSIAHGILDDETYDWLAVVRAMITTGGEALVVTEETLRGANELARSAGFDVDPTGSAGLAGLIDLIASGRVHPDERALVLCTGVRR